MKSHFRGLINPLLGEQRQTNQMEGISEDFESPDHRFRSNKREKRKKLLMKTIIIAFPTELL